MRKKVEEILTNVMDTAKTGSIHSLVIFTLIPNPDDPTEIACGVQSAVDFNYAPHIASFLADYQRILNQQAGVPPDDLPPH
jgi:hypothetical protein